MAITIDYSDGVTPQYVIQIPRLDMIDATGGSPTEIRQLNINDFRRDLDDLMDDEVGMAFPTIHFHTPPLTVSGVTLARVLEILDPYVIEFEDGLYNVNIVGGNSNVSDVVVKNQVGVNTSNSAGLQDPFALQAASFSSGEVAIDVNATATGTTFPFGTRSFPVNNVSDALAVATDRGLHDIRVLSNMTLGSGDFSDGYTFIGDNLGLLLTLDSAADVVNCEFKNMTVTGVLDGANTLNGCVVNSLNMFNGYIQECGITGTISLGGTATASVVRCYSLIAGGGPGQTAFIDLGGAQVTPLVVRDWQGGLCIQNVTSQDPSSGVSIDMSSGRVVFDSDVTAGEFTVRGLARVEDNSTGTAAVSDLTITADMSLTRKALTNTKVLDDATSIMTVMDDDDVTPVIEYDVYEDSNETQVYRNRGYNVQRKRP